MQNKARKRELLTLHSLFPTAFSTNTSRANRTRTYTRRPAFETGASTIPPLLHKHLYFTVEVLAMNKPKYYQMHLQKGRWIRTTDLHTAVMHQASVLFPNVLYKQLPSSIITNVEYTILIVDFGLANSIPLYFTVEEDYGFKRFSY